MTISNEKQFIKRWLIEIRSDCNELVSSNDSKVPLYLTFESSNAGLIQLTPESKLSDLMTEEQFDELVARLKREYFSQEYENVDV